MRERAGPVGYLSIRTRTYVMPDGHESDWDILIGGRTVAVVALTDDNEIILTRQYRPGPGRVLLDLPGGIVEDREEVIVAAARELSEETGFVAEHIELVGQTWLASWATQERYAVLATGCRPLAEQRLDRDEYCELVVTTFDQFVAHVRTGQLADVDAAWMCLDRLRPSDFRAFAR